MLNDSELNRLAKKFSDPDYRYGFTDEHLNTQLSSQISATRKARGLTQKQLAELVGTGQSRISALEHIDHDSWTITTLRKVARALDVALNVSFEAFSETLERIAEFDATAAIASYEEDLRSASKEQWVVAQPAIQDLPNSNQGFSDQLFRLQRPNDKAHGARSVAGRGEGDFIRSDQDPWMSPLSNSLQLDSTTTNKPVSPTLEYRAS